MNESNVCLCRSRHLSTQFEAQTCRVIKPKNVVIVSHLRERKNRLDFAAQGFINNIYSKSWSIIADIFEKNLFVNFPTE